MDNKILTIDGASGVGKGTIAKIIAQNNNWNLLDSGSIYRVFALKVQDLDNPTEQNLAEIALNLNLEFKDDKTFLDKKDVSLIIRTEQIGNLASKFAQITKVRTSLLQRQRDFATSKGLVADGRDMATVVFPNAKYQVFLTASIEERVKRRVKQLQIADNSSKIDEVFKSISERDARDKNRATSPLIPSKNALIIDTSNLSITQVITKITDYMSSQR